jgi:hypothetical protein
MWKMRSGGLSLPAMFFIEKSVLDPRSETTVCAVTTGNVAQLDVTAFVVPLICFRVVRTIEYKGEQCGSGEGVSQSPLKDKAF